MQQTLAVFAIGRRASTEMSRQIRQFFPDNAVLISAYCLDDLRQSAQTPVKADLAVFSCSPVLASLSAYLSPATPAIVARRTLSLDVINQLMDLPAGTKALLVTKNTLAISEFTKTIEEMGISHISLFSFLTHEPQTCASIETILLADEPDQIPPWATKIIDLGVREIELASLIEIANRLNQPLTINAPISTHYLQEIVARSELQIQTLKAVDLLNQQLNAVLCNVQDGLIVVDADCLVRFLNNLALDLVGADAAQAIGKPLGQIIPELKPVINANHRLSPGENIVTLGDRLFHISLQSITDKAGQFIGSVISLRNVTEVMRMEREVRHALKIRGHIAKYTFTDIIGESPAIKETVHTARKLAASELNVLIYGENGTGKELFAHSIHSASPRAGGPFIAVNCAALPPSLLESELFGYEDGAFTGAKRGGKPGLIEQADSGTIFLDEIGDISPEAQSRLLRVIQERAIMRVSGTRVIAVNARIIAATNKNLLAMIDKGDFRQDLFYRLFVAPVHIPPLRKRLQDIPLLLRYFIRESQGDERFLDSELLNRLTQHSWPGNIRELQSLIQYAAVVGDDISSFKKAIISRIESFRDAPPSIPINLHPDQLPLYLDILAVFAEAKRHDVHLGRGSLLKRLPACHFPVSEQAIRGKIVRLKEAGLLSSGAGRQGTQITDSGEAFLTAMRHYAVKATNPGVFPPARF